MAQAHGLPPAGASVAPKLPSCCPGTPAGGKIRYSEMSPHCARGPPVAPPRSSTASDYSTTTGTSSSTARLQRRLTDFTPGILGQVLVAAIGQNGRPATSRGAFVDAACQ
jgi:hypothetical protein